MDAPVGTVGINISSIFDGMYFGFVLATLLSGVTIVQGWNYVNNFKDLWLTRIPVGILILLISNFGNLAQLSLMTKSLNFEIVITVALVFLVQVFFASHIYQLDKKSTEKNKILFGIRGSFSTIAGIITSIALTYLLANAKRKVTLQRSDKLAQKILKFIVGRGLLVSVAQILFLAIYLTHPHKLYWVPLHFMSSKVYVITMMTILNERKTARSIEEESGSASSIVFNHPVPMDPPNRLVSQRTLELAQFSEVCYVFKRVIYVNFV
ncbi:hypothetical protein BJ138DRAFT_401033 [Hygrophoropsis aurantiaca]|uniref:Uncharacterized protein n=1 Tax=Hygrophoropsis aurantiaca TaxID=72124 RepID=A0ACB8AMD4_9AGAM|nr:hypothetical protein BJ138DRAFT_401033 [Hygrophoropsis aurantiaca]